VRRTVSIAVGASLLALVVLAASVTVTVPCGCDSGATPSSTSHKNGGAAGERPGDGAGRAASGTPRLIDFGSKECIPCKMMAPILEELKTEYAGRLRVEFVDIWLPENKPIAREYDIRIIPTQVFLAPDGRELWRHEGFLSKEAILAKWKELGYDLGAAAGGSAPRPDAAPAAAGPSK